MNNTKTVRKVAIVGYNRIPFARANTAYASVGNQEMMTAALNGLVDKYKLQGQLLGEVAGGAVIKHTYDNNLIRECVMKTALDPATPACDLQQACDTGIESAVYIANKISLGQIESGIAGGVDSISDMPIAVSEKLRKILYFAFFLFATCVTPPEVVYQLITSICIIVVYELFIIHIILKLELTNFK